MYDPEVNPGAVAWFKASAVHLLDRVPGYLALLAAHQVACERLESADPGRIVYEDEDQVVVVPTAAGRAATRSDRDRHRHRAPAPRPPPAPAPATLLSVRESGIFPAMPVAALAKHSPILFD